jgi:mono/diheme cytochrome c family protein
MIRLQKQKLLLGIAVVAVFLATGSVFFLFPETNSELPKSELLTQEKSKPVTAVQRGRLVYEKYGCGMCHGPDGKKGIKNPNSQTEQIPAVIYVKEGYTLTELKTRITKGISYIPPADPKKPAPPYRMPGWGDRMTRQEVDDLCAYLFSLMPAKSKEEW